jgi:hypothetical protein
MLGLGSCSYKYEVGTVKAEDDMVDPLIYKYSYIDYT